MPRGWKSWGRMVWVLGVRGGWRWGGVKSREGWVEFRLICSGMAARWFWPQRQRQVVESRHEVQLLVCLIAKALKGL